MQESQLLIVSTLLCRITHILYVLWQGRVQYEIVGDFPSPYFFKINQNNGLISIANNLKTDKAFSYKVNVEATPITAVLYKSE